MSHSVKSSEKIVKSAALVSVAVLFSRVLGLIREQIFAGLFGAGYAYDAFVVAFRIPNLLRDLFGEGALSAAFVSVFSDYDANRSKEETWLLASNVLCFFAITLSCIILIGIYFSDSIVNLIASDYRNQDGKAELTATMTMIMMPFLLFISLSAVVMGILNTRGRFFIPAIDGSYYERMFALEKAFPENIFLMAGLHPTHVKADYMKELEIVKNQLDSHSFCAVGEIGMDLYWDKSFVKEQQEAFLLQIGWAKERKLPIVIHCRDAFDEIFEVLDQVNDDRLFGIFHCFTGNRQQADKIINFGFKLGIG